MMLSWSAGMQAQKKIQKAKPQPLEVVLSVVNEAGQAIPNAEVVVGEGLKHGTTDGNGRFVVKSQPTDYITVSEPGFEKQVVALSALRDNSKVTLKASLLYHSADDYIPLPYLNYMYKRNATGDYYVITGKDLEHYPSADLRNCLTGLIPGLIVTENEGSTGTSPEETRGNYGVYEKVGIRTRGNKPLYLIDDVEMDLTEMQLDPQEVETITFCKDVVGQTIYGPHAANGIVYIKTKRGRSNDRILNANVEYGIQTVDRFPEYANTNSYATLNNTARTNSALTPLYNDAAFAGYAKNDPYDMYYPSIDFRKMMFKNSKDYRRVNVSSAGGNNVVKYFAYLGYTGEGDNFKIGHSADFTRLNARTNLDVTVNRSFKVSFDFFGNLSLRRSPNYGYNSLGIFEFASAVSDARTTPPNAFPIYAGQDPQTGVPWYGISANYRNNPIGDLVSNGFYTETGRLGSSNVTLTWDMGNFVKGLKSSTMIGFNVLNLTRIGKQEQYAAYIVTPNDSMTDYTINRAWAPVSMSAQTKLYDYYFQRYSAIQHFTYDRTFNRVHDLSMSLNYYISKFTRGRVEFPQKEQQGSWSGRYTYDGKYTAQAALSYAGTVSLKTKNQYRLFPSFGASWVVSEEGFMKSQKFFDFLKLRAEWGNLGYQNNTPATGMYEEKWLGGSGTAFGPYTNNRWFGTSTETPSIAYYNKVANRNLNWETRKEFSVGLDAVMLHRRLTLNATYYNNEASGVWTRASNKYPLATGILAVPYTNYNKYRYYGAEISARYTDHIGDFRYSVMAMATLPHTKYLVYDEPQYRDVYQRRTGRSMDAIFGFVYKGRFTSDAETEVVPQLFDESLHAGDFKYEDLNNDGVVDNNDTKQIGHSAPHLYYGLNLNLSYRDFDFILISDGRAFYDEMYTNTYFMNGWGDNNYSKYVVRNYNNPDKLPTLTYYQVANNWKGSTFYMHKGGYFKIQNIELAYNLPLTASNALGVRKVRFFVRGANLLTVSGTPDVDPESFSSGIDRYPLNRTFSGGINLTF